MQILHPSNVLFVRNVMKIMFAYISHVSQFNPFYYFRSRSADIHQIFNE